MPDSKRLTIIKAIETELKKIKVSGNYNTNMGLNVTRWKPIPQSENVTATYQTGVVVRDITQERALDGTRQPYPVEDFILNVEIEATHQSNSAQGGYNDYPAYIIEDLRNCLGADETLGGYAFKIDWLNDNVTVQSGKNVIVKVICNIAVYYRVNRWSN